MLALLAISHRKVATALLPAVLAFSWTWLQAAQQLEQRWDSSARDDVSVRGYVSGFPRAGPERTAVTLRVLASDRAVPAT